MDDGGKSHPWYIYSTDKPLCSATEPDDRGQQNNDQELTFLLTLVSQRQFSEVFIDPDRQKYSRS